MRATGSLCPASKCTLPDRRVGQRSEDYCSVALEHADYCRIRSHFLSREDPSMIRARIAGSQDRIGVVLICALSAAFTPAAHASGPGIASKLERAGVIDNYFPEVVVEVAGALTQAAPGRWPGVQVNQGYRAGWLNIYL